MKITSEVFCKILHKCSDLYVEWVCVCVCVWWVGGVTPLNNAASAVESQQRRTGPAVYSSSIKETTSTWRHTEMKIFETYGQNRLIRNHFCQLRGSVNSNRKISRWIKDNSWLPLGFRLFQTFHWSLPGVRPPGRIFPARCDSSQCDSRLPLAVVRKLLTSRTGVESPPVCRRLLGTLGWNKSARGVYCWPLSYFYTLTQRGGGPPLALHADWWSSPLQIQSDHLLCTVLAWPFSRGAGGRRWAWCAELHPVAAELGAGGSRSNTASL